MEIVANNQETKQVKPFPKLRMFSDHILTTARTNKVTKSGVILNEGKGEMFTRQTVVCCGPASGLEPGMDVELNPNRFEKVRIPAKYETGPDTFKVVFPLEIIDGEQYLLISTREIKFAYEPERNSGTNEEPVL